MRVTSSATAPAVASGELVAWPHVQATLGDTQAYWAGVPVRYRQLMLARPAGPRSGPSPLLLTHQLGFPHARRTLVAAYTPTQALVPLLAPAVQSALLPLLASDAQEAEYVANRKRLGRATGSDTKKGVAGSSFLGNFLFSVLTFMHRSPVSRP